MNSALLSLSLRPQFAALTATLRASKRGGCQLVPPYGSCRHRAFSYDTFRRAKEKVTDDPETTTTTVMMTSNKSAMEDDDEPSPDNNNNNNVFNKFPFIDSTLRGMGQVVFANSPLSGLTIIGGLAIADPILSAMSVLGCTASTATGNVLSEPLGLDTESIKDGLCGYNGALVGCAFSLFLDVGSPAIAAATVMGGMASTVLMGGLGKVITTTVPQFTLAFNTVVLGTLSYTQPFRNTADAAQDTTAAATSVMEDVAITVVAASNNPLATTTTAEASSLSLSLPDPTTLLLAPFTGISQIYVAESAICGAIILTALYVQRFDPRGDKNSTSAVLHTIAGSSLGIGTALCLGVPIEDITTGLCGFNPAITALAVHTFVQPSWYSYGIAGLGAVSTTVLTESVLAPIAYANLYVPVCSVPFCIVASGCLIVADQLGVKRRV